MPFDITSGLNMAEERISKLEDRVLKTSKREKETKRLKKQSRVSKNKHNYQRCYKHIMGILEGEERQEKKKYLKQ